MLKSVLAIVLSGGMFCAVAQRNESANQDFTRSGTGAVERTVQEKLRETVSVKDFGALCDGATNDAVAFQAAIDYVESVGGGTISIPSGTCVLQNSVTLGGQGVKAKGEAVVGSLVTTVENVDQIAAGCSVNYFVCWSVLQ